MPRVRCAVRGLVRYPFTTVSTGHRGDQRQGGPAAAGALNPTAARVWDSRRAQRRGAVAVVCTPGTPGVLRATAPGAGRYCRWPPAPNLQARSDTGAQERRAQRVIKDASPPDRPAQAPRGYPRSGACRGRRTVGTLTIPSAPAPAPRRPRIRRTVGTLTIPSAARAHRGTRPGLAAPLLGDAANSPGRAHTVAARARLLPYMVGAMAIRTGRALCGGTLPPRIVFRRVGIINWLAPLTRARTPFRD